ncbi:MAG: hypothetical protein JNK15_14135, partial [Planctomycetes bacterium]|nr:hypothetical protein [Planctomycetota bacterium]
MRTRSVLRVAVAVAVAAAFARAQQPGSLRGVVRDQDFDVPLAAATGQIVELGLRAETNDQGLFTFPQVPA